MAWDEAIRLDGHFGMALGNRAYYHRLLGQNDEAEQDRRLALDYAPELAGIGQQLLPAELYELPILDVWTRHTDVIGSELRSSDRQAEVVMLRLSQEFMATDNIRVLGQLESVLAATRAETKDYPEGLMMGLTGSAAVGGDMLRSAAESIKNTELYTIVMVVLILIVVYRSPLLVLVPLVTIGVSVAVSTSLVAALTQVNQLPGFEWWNFRIFTTTKIFVVVILFGAGTDFCLFLISRYREELDAGHDTPGAVSTALAGVGEALAASAMTTIIGLATMFFAQFGKFRNSGPAIGLCLTVTLLACLTLAPALLRGLGPAVFWRVGWGNSTATAGNTATPQGRVAWFWQWLSQWIVAYPGTVLVVSTALMLPLALAGLQVKVTYDFLSELDASRPSKRGTQLMRQHFPIGETGPLTVLARTDGGDLDSPEGKTALLKLTHDLYLDGVREVRSLAEPRGERTNGYSLKKAALQAHELTRSLYLSQLPELGGDVARLELILDYDPFSLEATGVVKRLAERLQAESENPDSYWYRHPTEFAFAGTTAAICDLRDVTRRDNLLIQALVVLAVLLVLLVVLRRPVVCLYLILSVLFSYYVTMGATEWFFRWAYGETFEGLDWKVPLFLFVILVAIGQDYNIYLVTRVFEEQARYGLIGGLQHALVRTGGIITSCGVIMAGTFVSMTTGSLRAIVELGFALSLGVLLDTFVVRTILVPAFLALLFRRLPTTPTDEHRLESPHLFSHRRSRIEVHCPPR